MNTSPLRVPDDLSDLGSPYLIRVVVISYGEGHQDPPGEDGLLVNLVDALRNPPEDPAARERLTHLTGLDKAVREYVMATPGARAKVMEVYGQALALLHGYAEPRHRIVFVLVKCWGGRHRSVAVAEEVAAMLRADGIGVEVEHRHVGRPLLPCRGRRTQGGAP